MNRTLPPEDIDAPDDVSFPRFASRGHAFVYIAPCRDDNVFKVGFSRNPLERFRTLHPRFFEFFDFERGLLIATDYVREARRLERRLILALKDYQALQPLVVTQSAAGQTEWFRGALVEAEAIAAEFESAEGFTIYRPAGAWLRLVLRERQDLLFAWATRMFEAIEYETHNRGDRGDAATYENALRNTLDAYAAFSIDLATLLPSDVNRWYANRRER